MMIRAMDERAMDAAMNPREERHRDEYVGYLAEPAAR